MVNKEYHYGYEWNIYEKLHICGENIMVTGNSKNHKSLLSFLLSLIVQIATPDCYLKSTFATHMDYPLDKSRSGKSYPPQLQIYSLLNMC